LDVPVSNQNLLLLAEAPRQLLANENRPVLTASAADCDCDGGAVIAHERRQPASEESGDIVNKFGNVGIGLEEFLYRLIPAG
jgi:hypothetical protein